MLKFGNTFVNFGGTYLTGWDSAPLPPSFDEVTIGTQTWMSKNLDIDDGGEGIKTYDFTNDPVLSALGIQYYYTIEAAQRIANTIDGWHLPSKDEWNTLIYYVGQPQAGTKLKSTFGWYNNGNGTDDYGFCALPIGHYNNINSTKLSTLYERTQFLSHTLYIGFTWNQSYINNISDGSHPPPLCPVRLIKDY